MAFQKAVKTQAKLRMAIVGPSGGGKTYTALQVAKLLGGATALIDSEHGSASKYADEFSFDTDSLEEFSIKTYLASMEAASTGYENLIIDSLSHAWAGRGGALEQVENITSASRSGNAFSTGWREVGPLQTRLIDSIVAFPANLIATMRTKSEYVLEEKNGKKIPKKIGLAPVQRADMDYEFDVVLDVDTSGRISVSKTRCKALAGFMGRYEDVPRLVAKLKEWLGSGEASAPRKPLPPAPVEAPVTYPSKMNGQRLTVVDAANEKSPEVNSALLAISLATDKAQLEGLAATFNQLSSDDRAALRGPYVAKMKEVAQ